MRQIGAVHIIVNPHAGRGKSQIAGRQTRDRLVAAGLEVRIDDPGSPQETVHAARQAWTSGARVVVACGGDGTVNRVLQGLMQAADATHLPTLGLIPCGTGNDNARSLGIPASIDRACQALVADLGTGRSRVVDVAALRTAQEQGWFIGVLSTGFDSSVNERANRRTWPAGRAKYVLAMLAELGSFRPVDYVVDIDGTRVAGPGTLVSVGNGANYGGGMRICPQAKVDDGVLELTWVGPVSKRVLLGVFPRVFAGSHMSHPGVRGLRGTRITISADRQVAYADGERFGALPVQIALDAGALDVVGTTVPA